MRGRERLEEKMLMNKRLFSLLIVSFAIVIVMLFFISMKAAGDNNRPESQGGGIYANDPDMGPWMIFDGESFESSDFPGCTEMRLLDTNMMSGGLLIQDGILGGGSLQLKDIDLVIGTSASFPMPPSGIDVSGKFEFIGETGGVTMSATGGGYYYFNVNGELTLQDATIQDVGYDMIGDSSGIIIDTNGEVIITGCTIEYYESEGINCTSASQTTIEDTTIRYGDIGLTIMDEPEKLDTLTITNNEVGIRIYDDSPIINNTLISGSSENAIECYEDASPSFENCTITDSTNYDFYVTNDANLYVVVTSFDGGINVDSEFASLTVQWFINLTTLVANTDDVVPGAKITITDNRFIQEGPDYYTDQNGKKMWIKIIEYIESGMMGTIRRTPHKINAEKTGYGEPGEIEVDVEIDTDRTTHIIFLPIPDLTVSGDEISFSTTENVTMQQEMIQVSAKVKNIGRGETSCDIGFWYYEENDPDNKNSIDTFNDFLITGEQEMLVQVDWDIGNIPLGYYNIYVEISDADPKEINEDNNANPSTNTIRIISRPDLNFTKWELKEDITISDYSPVEGDKIQVNVNVHNNGDANASSTVNFAYESTNKDEFTSFGSRNIFINGMVFGINEQTTGNVELDTTGLLGEYLIQVKIEDADPWETDTTNNIIEDTIFIYSKPDLNFTEWNKEDINITDNRPMESDIVILNATVHNLGETEATCDVELKYRPLQGGLYSVIDTKNINVKGENHTTTPDINWDTTDLYGWYILNVTIKNSNPAESNENNNYYEHLIRVYSRPDLNFTNWETKDDFIISNDRPNEGDTISMNITVQNLGEIKSDFSNITFSFKKEGTNDQFTEIETVNILVDGNMSGNNQNVTEDITWDTNGYRGWYIIKVLIKDSAPSEKHLNNNEIFERIYIYGKPEMIVYNITFSKYDPLINEKINIKASIRNLGDNDAKDFNITFYDNEIKEENIINSTTTTVNGHDSKNITFGWIIPSDGDHTIWVDITDVPNESDTTNNNKSAIIHVNTHPDFKLTDKDNITFSNNAPDEDDVITIFASITNIGEANGTGTIKFYDGAPKDGNLIGQVNNVLVNGSYYKKNYGIENVTVVSIPWDLTGIFGSHDIFVVLDNVDPTENITAQQNNEGYVTLYINDRPTADNISASNNKVYRTETIKIYTNATDTDENEGDLTIEILYRMNDNDPWDNDYLDVPQYITDHWEVDFTPKKEAKLGLYDFGVNFTDTKGAKCIKWLIVDDLVEVMNNDPIIIGTIPDKSAKEDMNITFDLTNYKVNSDIEDIDDVVIWSANYDDLIIEDVVVAENIVTFVPIKNNTEDKPEITTEVLIILIDTDGGTDSQFVELKWTQILDPPAIYIDAPSFVYRTETIYIFINGTDAEDDEKDLSANLTYKNATSKWINLTLDWNDVSNYWSANLMTNISMDPGIQTFNITLEDPDGNITTKLFKVDVKNNFPESSIASSENSVYRTQTIMLYVNGTDIENKEEDLICVVDYRKPSGDWENTYLGDLTWNGTEGYWNITFMPPIKATIGDYEFRTELTDLDGGKNSTTRFVEVMNNLPVIIGTIPNPDNEDEDNDITFDFTNYESDIEDSAIKLKWYVNVYDKDAISSISGENSSNDELIFTPIVNFSGTTELEIVLMDLDGGKDTQMMYLTWINVNDMPNIESALIEPDPAYTNDIITAKAINWTDGDGDSEGYQYEWQKYNSTSKSWDIISGEFNVTLDGSTLFDKHDLIRVKITPDDGNATNNLGYPRISDPIEISNSLPTINSVELTATTDPNDVNKTSIFTATPKGYNDADGDPLFDYRYIWKNENGDTLLDGYGENKLDGTKFNKGDVIYCNVSANDGEDEGVQTESSHILIHNSPPNITSISFTPVPAGVEDTLYVDLTWSDPDDGDNPTFLYEWYHWNGTDWKKIAGANNDNYTLDSHIKGDQIKVVVTPDDQDIEYNVGESKNTTITISNTPPRITLLDIIPDLGYTNDTIVAVVFHEDPDGWDNNNNNVTYYYQWQKWNFSSGQFEDIEGQTDQTLDGWGDNFSKNDIVRVLVTPNDKTDNGTTIASLSVTINNTAPRITDIFITPSPGKTNETLTANMKSHDDDNDTVTYSYQWQSYMWDVWDDIIGQTNMTLDPAYFSREDKNIRVMIIPFDGTDYGSEVISPEIIIENTPPFVISIEIDPVEAYTNDILNALVKSWDDDGDDISYYYQWQRNNSGTWENLAGQTSMTLDGWGDNFSKFDEIRVIITPNDGTVNGTDYISNPIIIMNSKATIESVEITPEDSHTNDDLTATPNGYHDDDNDVVVHYYYYWVEIGIDGDPLLEGIGQNVLDSTLFYKDQRIGCNVTAYDGDEYGVPKMSSGRYIFNTPATITDVTITHDSDEITEAYINWSIEAEPEGWFDIDGDPETYGYNWTIGGKNVGDEKILFLDYKDFKKGDRIELIIQPKDLNSTLIEYEDNEKTKVIFLINTPPMIDGVILESTPANATETSILEAKIVNPYDADDDKLTYTYIWKENGVEIVGAPNLNTLTGTYFNKEDIISVSVTPNDGTDDGGEKDSNTITISNTISSIDSVMITPDPATKNTNLLATPGIWVDVDGDTPDYIYEWQNDGTPIVGAENTLDSSEFSKGDNIKVICWPFDGTWKGDPVEDEITILNSKPMIDRVTLVSDTNPAQVKSDLFAEIIDPFDADGDNIIFDYSWKNLFGAEIDSGFTSESIIILNNDIIERFVKNDVITITVTPRDDEESGDPIVSESITIENTAPVMENVNIDSDTDPPREKSTISTVVNAADDDEDTITYMYDWYKNDIPISGADSNTLNGNYFNHDDKIYVDVTPYDGENYGALMQSNIITIENTPPVIGTVTISIDPTPDEADTAKEGYVLTAMIENAVDDDGSDVINYNYKWKNNGNIITQASTSSNILTSEFFKKGNLISVTITPRDSTENGIPVDSSNSIEILNTKPSIDEARITMNDKKVNESKKGDVLTVETILWYDVDGDEEGYKYQWQIFENKSWINIKDADVNKFSLFKKGDNIRVKVTPWDGDDNGVERTSQEVVIINSAPEGEIAYPNDMDEFTIGSNIDLNADVIDMDNDELTYDWTIDGKNLGTGNKISIDTIDLLNQKILKIGEQKIELTVTDGDAEIKDDVEIVLVGPDLEIIEDIKFDGKIKDGKTVTINAPIKNIGNQVAKKVKVKFFYADNLLGEDIIANISAGESATASLEWSIEKMKGNQTIKVYVDPDNAITEFNEKNNEYAPPIDVKSKDKAFPIIIPIIIIIILVVLIIGLFAMKSRKEEAIPPPLYQPQTTTPMAPIPAAEPEIQEPVKPEPIVEPIPIIPLEKKTETPEVEKVDEEIAGKPPEEEVSEPEEETDEIDKELEDVDKELDSISKELEELESGETWESLAELRSRILEEEKEESQIDELADRRKELMEEEDLEE